MPLTTSIRLLSADRNEKGDLFTRLTENLFFALGYGELERDLAQPGREIDVMGKHRTEARRMCAECKAHQKSMGGDEVNKFRGALLSEQRKPGALPTVGYFLSLGGFTGTAREQEKLHGADAIIFLDAPRIIEELEGGRFIVTDAKATEQAGRCMQHAGVRDLEVAHIELLGHKLGYIKAIYFAHNKKLTHVALIHADGTPLSSEVANSIIEADKAIGGQMHTLRYLAPAPLPPDLQQKKELALAFYQRWLEKECGYIQLDGLPLDNHKRIESIPLEKLFVPMVAELVVDTSHLDANSPTEMWPEEEQIYPIGELIANYKYIALLAAPGGGKSTLLKRLATAYGIEGRLTEIKDNLPAEPWLPLFLRCRELRSRTDHSIMQVLDSLPAYLNMDDDLADGFRAVLRERLRVGQVLLLVDGLDEITDEGSRKTFADNLRRFLVSYPQVSMVVTSRIAGFRTVAGVIGQVCREAHLASLSEDDIRYLCTQWFLQFNEDTPVVRRKAYALAEQIITNRSVFVLAQNPLLLTTLLAVQRNNSELPTNRADLYRETVKLLVRTWNVEGFKPMAEREAMVQLCYVACSMMEQGIQQIPYESLLELLFEARQVLAADLQYAKISPEDFIVQVEYRSSLLMRVGQEKISGEWQDVYEFRHLTFQEYLAAEGYVKRRHKRRRDNSSLVELLQPHLTDSDWQEVISLAAVLADDQAEPLIESLVATCESIVIDDIQDNYDPFVLLGKCLLDELAVEPTILRAALRQAARFADFPPLEGSVFNLLQGPGGSVLEQVIEEGYLGEADWLDFAEAMKLLSGWRVLGFHPGFATYEVETGLPELLEAIAQGLEAAERDQRIAAAFAFISLTDGVNVAEHRGHEKVAQGCTPLMAERLFTGLIEMACSADNPAIYAACEALRNDANSAELLATAQVDTSFLLKLFGAWRRATSWQIADTIAAVILACAPFERITLPNVSYDSTGAMNFLLEKVEPTNKRSSYIEARAAIVFGWYWRKPWQDTELVELVNLFYMLNAPIPYLRLMKSASIIRGRSILQTLGLNGQNMLKEWDQKHNVHDNNTLPF